MKRTGKPVFFIVAILIIALTYAAFFGISNYYGDTREVYIKGAQDIRWGIDIQGGVEAVFSPDMDKESITNGNMDAAKEIIETRLLNQNIADSEVFLDYDNKQVIVRFPWQADEKDFNPTAAVAELGETAQLSFYNGDDNSTQPFMDGSVVTSAVPGYDEEHGYVVQLQLNSNGAGLFEQATQKAASEGTNISIYMDDMNISTASCNEAISGGTAIIYGQFTSESATELANKISAGSLPFALTVDDSKLQVISPTLGTEALNVMLIAGIIAFVVICVIMIIKYRLCGVIASIALLGQVGGMFACVSGFFNGIPSFTLTIPGIAGIILSIGMGVDANVIMSERIKEEFENGKTIDGAIDTGYQRSFSAIMDGNVTVMIVALILMSAFGTPDSFLAEAFNFITFGIFTSSITGSIYSFGFTLLTGVIFNLIMGVYCSKFMTKGISRFKFMRKPWLYGGAKNEAK